MNGHAKLERASAHGNLNGTSGFTVVTSYDSARIAMGRRKRTFKVRMVPVRRKKRTKQTRENELPKLYIKFMIQQVINKQFSNYTYRQLDLMEFGYKMKALDNRWRLYVGTLLYWKTYRDMLDKRRLRPNGSRVHAASSYIYIYS